ncbi:MAG: hypothetical protein ABEH43_09760, partial [Flavobacteriales bacterium]
MKNKLINTLLSYIPGIIILCTPHLLLETNSLRKSEETIAHQFSDQINEKLSKVNDSLQKAKNNHPFNFKSIDKRFDEFPKGRVDKNGYAFYYYEKKSLKYWSDNSVPLNDLPPISEISEKPIKLSNGWYYPIKENINEKEQLLALLLIKRSYPYENRYLSNGVPECFNLPENVKIYFGFDDNIQKRRSTPVKLNNNTVFH